MRNERLIVVFWRLVDFGVNSLGNLAILRICSCLARDRYCNIIFTTWFIEISSSFSRLKRWPWWAWTFQDELSKLHKPGSRTPIRCCFQLTLSFDSINFLGPHWLRIVSVYSLRPNLCKTASLTRTFDGNWEYTSSPFCTFRPYIIVKNGKPKVQDRHIQELVQGFR